MLIALSPTVMVDLLGFEHAVVPLKNPALVTMPLAFVTGIAASLLRPETAAAERFEAVEEQMHLGHAEERVAAG